MALPVPRCTTLDAVYDDGEGRHPAPMQNTKDQHALTPALLLLLLLLLLPAGREATARFTRLEDAFSAEFGAPPTVLVRSPGASL